MPCIDPIQMAYLLKLQEEARMQDMDDMVYAHHAYEVEHHAAQAEWEAQHRDLYA